MAGRPSKFTPENRAKIVEATESGSSRDDAARRAGITAKTLKMWLAKGRKEKTGDYFEFMLEVEDARQRARERKLSIAEHQQLLARACRNGSIQALKLWHEIYGGEEVPDADNDTDPFGSLDQEDELARARAKRAA